MISYIFSTLEFKFLCSAMKLNILTKHRFEQENSLDIDKARSLLIQKGFISVKNEQITVNSGIELFLKEMNSAERVFIRKESRCFTAYISQRCSVLLIDDTNSKNLMLYPFESENKLVDWLYCEKIYSWEDYRLER